MNGFALHGDAADEPVLGRLVARGLHDELKGTAYAIIEGVDGRTHHLTFSDIEVTGDARAGAIVETRAYDRRRRPQAPVDRHWIRISSVEAQVTALRRDLDRPAASRTGACDWRRRAWRRRFA